MTEWKETVDDINKSTHPNLINEFFITISKTFISCLRCILSAFQNCIFFHRIYFFLRKINKSQGDHFEN